MEKRALAESVLTEADFRLLFERSPALYLALTPDLVIAAVTDSYAAATLTRREEIVGRPLFEVFPDNPDRPGATGQAHLRASLERVLASGLSDAMPLQRYDIQRPDGAGFEERTWSPHNTPVFDETGRLVYILHEVTDVVQLERREGEQSRANRALNEVNDRLRQEKRRTQHLLEAYERAERVASRFQAVALPAELPHVPGIKSSAVYQAAEAQARLGGDWYDVFRLPDGRLILSVGDVAGSGLDAAVTMGSVRQSIRTAALINPDPIAVLDAVDRIVRAMGHERFVTAFIGVVDPVTFELSFAAAGHPAPLLRRPDGELVPLSNSDLPLGLRRQGEGRAMLVQVPAGSSLAAFTDGLLEVDRDPIKGESVIAAAFRSQGGESEAQRLYEAVTAGRASHDDIAILVLSFDAPLTEVDDPLRASTWSFSTNDAVAAGVARLEFVERLGSLGLSPEDLLAAELAFGELIGNTVRHAPGNVRVYVDVSAAAPVLHVVDQGGGYEHRPRLPSDIMSERGRGLFLVQAFTEEFSVERQSNGGSHARAVLQGTIRLGPRTTLGRDARL